MLKIIMVLGAVSSLLLATPFCGPKYIIAEEDLPSYVKATQEGDPKKTEALIGFLYITFYERLQRLPDANDREEIAQVAATRVFKQINKYQVERGPFLPWAFTIFRNSRNDILSVRRPFTLEDWDHVDREVASEAGSTFLDFQSALATLPEKDQKFFLDFVNSPLPSGEQAKQLGMNRNTFDGKVFRIRGKLAEKMGVPFP